MACHQNPGAVYETQRCKDIENVPHAYYKTTNLLRILTSLGCILPQLRYKTPPTQMKQVCHNEK